MQQTRMKSLTSFKRPHMRSQSPEMQVFCLETQNSQHLVRAVGTECGHRNRSGGIRVLFIDTTHRWGPEGWNTFCFPARQEKNKTSKHGQLESRGKCRTDISKYHSDGSVFCDWLYFLLIQLLYSWISQGQTLPEQASSSCRERAKRGEGLNYYLLVYQ